MKNKNLIFLFFILKTTFCMAQRNYEVLPMETIFKIFDEGKIVSKVYIDWNDAVLTELEDGRFILSPSDGNEGILYYDVRFFYQMLEVEYFPVKDFETDIFSRNRKLLRHVESNIPEFLLILEKEVKMKIILSEDKIYLDKLSKKINIYLKSHDLEEIILPLGVFMGELVRKKSNINTHWKNRVVYFLNPYWIPYIGDDKGGTYEIFSELWEKESKINLQKILSITIDRYFDGIHSDNFDEGVPLK